MQLIARDNATGRELSRRIRDDLVHLGRVDATCEVELRQHARAGVGDLIRARRNQDIEAGEADRTLANGDVLRIEAVNDDGSLTVRRLLEDRENWSDKFGFRDYRKADLGYCQTGHVAQGGTVDYGLPVVTGAEDRQWLYSAMTRGRLSNQAFVFTRPANVPEPQPGTRPAPELARHELIMAERDGRPVDDPPELGNPDPREALAVLSDVLERDGAERSALETLRQNMADADHLAHLNAMWEDQTRGLNMARYRSSVAGALPPGRDAAELDTRQSTWLWRTMRTVEAAGLDASEVVSRAVGSRSLTGARDLPSVIDARIRQQTAGLVPSELRLWSEQVPQCGGERQRFLTELATALDERKQRIGEFAAEHSPAWAVAALGPVPEDPLDRLEWEQRASHVGAYRELFGWTHDSEPIGPEPARGQSREAGCLARGLRGDDAHRRSGHVVVPGRVAAPHASDVSGGDELGASACRPRAAPGADGSYRDGREYH